MKNRQLTASRLRSKAGFTLLLGLLLIIFQSTHLQAESTDNDSAFMLFNQEEPYLNLYTGPGRGFPIFHIIEADESFKVIRRHTQWYFVETASGEEGWLSTESIAKSYTEAGNLFSPGFVGDDQYLSREWELGVSSGDFGGASSISGVGTYHFTPNISAEVVLMQSLGSASSSNLFITNLVQQPFPTWKYSPYFGIGAGLIRTDPKTTLINSEVRTNDLFGATLGFRRYFTQQFLFRAEYNHYVVFTNNDDNQELNGWKIGLSVFLQ